LVDCSFILLLLLLLLWQQHRCGTKILLDQCTKRKLIFFTNFHHIDENGYYVKAVDIAHKITVTPEFGGFDITVSGNDKNGIKDYIGDAFYEWLSSDLQLGI